METDRPFVNSKSKHKRSREEEVSRKELCVRLASCTGRNEKIERVGEEREEKRKAQRPRQVPQRTEAEIVPGIESGS